MSKGWKTLSSCVGFQSFPQSLVLIHKHSCAKCQVSPHVIQRMCLPMGWCQPSWNKTRGDIFQTVSNTFEPDKSIPESHIRQTKTEWKNWQRSSTKRSKSSPPSQSSITRYKQQRSSKGGRKGWWCLAYLSFTKPLLEVNFLFLSGVLGITRVSKCKTERTYCI